MSASARHAVLDTIVASFLEANPDKLPSTTTVFELIEWHHRQTADQAVEAFVTGAAAAAGRCRRCGQFLSATRVEMHLSLCSDCDRSHRR